MVARGNAAPGGSADVRDRTGVAAVQGYGPAAHRPSPRAPLRPGARVVPARTGERGQDFHVVALLSAYNEGDIISAVIRHLVRNGVSVYLIDNNSTDDTVEQASRWLGHGLVGIESFPDLPQGDPPGDGPRFPWSAILQRKERLSREIRADWFMHHDADEVREAPWPGCTLREGIRRVDALGYNCIDFEVFTFPPIDDSFRQGLDPTSHFTLYQPPSWYDFLQRKCWKATSEPVSLLGLGGHDVRFRGRRIFPVRFILRHYPIRSQQHGVRKVFAERRPRFLADERRRGWHRQYEHIGDEQHRFVANPASLAAFELDTVRAQLLAAGSPAVVPARRGALARRGTIGGGAG